MPYPSFPVYLGLTPADTDGPRVLKVPVPADATGKAALDLLQDMSLANLRFVQAVYFDLADLGTNAVITLTHRQTGFRVRIKGGTQGWFPFAVTEGAAFDLTYTNVAVGVVIPLWFSNVAAPNFQWASV